MMAGRHDVVRPNDYIFLRLASGMLKAVECKPNQIIDTARYGSFPSDQLIGRPYYYTYEFIEKAQDETQRLRIVPPAELDAELNATNASTSENRDVKTDDVNEAGYDLVAEDGQVLMKNNRLIVDDATRQALSHEEIEELKKNSAGKDVVEKILANHTALDEKNAFSKAKYTLRKTRKYLKRFVLLPMEIGYLLEYITEKEPTRIMDLREEPLALVGSWSNAHYAELAEVREGRQGEERILLVDDAGGIVLAALAERKNILRHNLDSRTSTATTNGNHTSEREAVLSEGGVPVKPEEQLTQLHNHHDFPMPAVNNSITLIHAAAQPNVSLLKYFGYDTNQPDPTHPLHTHLKPLSWLQLLHPEEDPLYCKPDEVDANILQSMKTNKRGAYYKKQRRWQRCSSIIDETRAGGFDSLVVASYMDPVSIFKHTIPLLRGGAHVVVYSATIDPLVKLMDLYSKERRTAYIHQITKYPEQEPDQDDFPLDPRLLLAPTLQTSRVREYQVLPGRTHPLMTSRGGNEGYVFTARRVIPLEGGIAARGNFSKKRKETEINGDGKS